ncbi:unnamed protein product [Ambrosiozyma monospora]|uniref:Unnamed protein product n=1 Tax=Ambrosiozyma monospora TaxID=43982 RepID=A0ACB5TC95_AMBMO|nr:unnamed protein product [Ambrosiozyma monospora]
MGVLITEQDFFDLAWSYFVKAKNNGVWHSETFFDPQGHTERGIKIETVVNGFNRAAKKAEAELGISTKLIMCLLKHLPVPNGMETLKSATGFYKQGLIHGLGLDSSELPFPPKLFTECYSYAAENFGDDVGLTAHAGEEGGPDYITQTLDLLKATRIDHGVNSYKDDAVMERLAREKIMLTLCPLSNVKLQVVEDVAELPVMKWLEVGVPFSINSDDPAYFGGYILDNYVVMHTRFGFDLDTWGKIAKFGVDGSWISNDRKKEINGKIDEVVSHYKKLIE